MQAMLKNGIKDANELATRVASQRKSGDAISPGRRTEDLQQERQELLATVQKAAAAAAELQVRNKCRYQLNGCAPVACRIKCHGCKIYPHLRGQEPLLAAT